ncbi:MAG: hypothetical protein NTY41_08820 [Proteobacteria bacterium]|nr:hypothetical protein [Pseudomonadota bacterium]
MFRNTSSMMGSFNNFSAAHAATPGLGNGTITGFGPAQMLNGGAGTPVSAGTTGLGSFPMMGNFLQHPLLNGAGAGSAPAGMPFLGSGATIDGSGGLHQTMVDAMQDILGDNAVNPPVAPGVAQNMFDFMADIHLVGLPHAGLFSPLG